MSKKEEPKKSELHSNIIEEDISKEMRTAYLDYAMSVITSRALPDVRDGLKPVARRVLFAMKGLRLTANAKTRKSSAVVGDVMGKYHPHGNASIYDAISKLIQNFSSRYPLIIGQGNFGSIDGDPPAAERYTEVKLSSLAEELLRDIDKETVRFRANYENTLQEPTVLPAPIPNLLLNGTLGIAVGMATSIPSHNAGEVCSALIHLTENPEATNTDLLKYIRGPDFPLGGIAYNRKAIEQAYSTGRGGVIVQGEAEVIETNKQTSIVITSLPIRVNKSDFVAKIGALVRDKKIEGVKDLRDESTDEIRVVIDLKTSANPARILAILYKNTQLQDTFHYNIVALVDGVPQTLSLRTLLQHHIDHRREIITRRATFDLTKASVREHILTGLHRALDEIDKIIKTIRASKDAKSAHSALKKTFEFSNAQATAILEMRLQKLAGLERKEIEDELKKIKALIKELEILLKSKKKIDETVVEEVQQMSEIFSDKRRTTIKENQVSQISDEDLIMDEETVVVMTNGGYVKRTASSEYRTQRRGGVGSKDLNTKEEDDIFLLLHASTRDTLFFFTNRGRVFSLKTHELPEGKRATRGKSIANFLQIGGDEVVTSIVPVSLCEHLLFVTRMGVVKKIKLDAFSNIRKTGIIACNLEKDDTLVSVLPIPAKNKEYSVVLATTQGKGVHFNASDLRAMGRSARGVKGITLQKGDEMASAVGVTSQETLLLTITQHGYGKMTPAKEYRKQKRGGKGIRMMAITEKTGLLVSMLAITNQEVDVVTMSEKGQAIRFRLEEVRKTGRATQGVRIMKPRKDDAVSTIVQI